MLRSRPARSSCARYGVAAAGHAAVVWLPHLLLPV